ncbi:PIN-like domain-containing protein [Bacillus cereus]|uniref:PIN-like domain-containing protein n=1 Tax=Bacillus cereus TaxID=1396 RepID=UPI00084C469B|nr:PIN-like domain-containing protein [Bacillus cereus]MCM3201614.1 PIN-like domain-containing protein [Bacillus cereus]MDN4100458.1 PIN-like domain-containing protein [Bacillus cereus]OED10863.1 hypothetical protein A9756_22540 [Bacillus cereus]OJE14565.1 hypothetical protein A9488_08855 [Bacillus cereus]
MENAVVYFDTSALLDLYFFTERTLDEIFEMLLSKLSERLYITDQNWFEYNKNKNKVLLKPRDTYQNLITGNGKKKENDGAHLEKINNALKELKVKGFEVINKQAEQFLLKTKKENRHPYLEQDFRGEFEKQIKDSFNKYESLVQSILDDYNKVQDILMKEITSKMDNIQKRGEIDSLPQLLSKHFKITNLDYKFSKILGIVEEGELRYRNKIPPGFEDQGEKEGIQIYGDLISWKQLLEHANAHKLPAILVSNDLKPDWVNETQQPCLELIKEYYDVSQQQFWIFSLSTFIHKLEERSGNLLKPSAKQEVNELEQVTTERLSSFPKVSLEIIEDFLISEYASFEIILETKDTLLYKCEGIKDESVYIHFEKALKSNYTSIINSMRKALGFLKDYKIDEDKFCLVHIAIGKQQAQQIINKHLTRAKARELFEENRDILNLRLAWVDIYNSNLEFVDKEISGG